MWNPPASPVVQPAGPLFSAARQPADNSCFSFGNTALQPAGPPFSVIQFSGSCFIEKKIKNARYT